MSDVIVADHAPTDNPIDADNLWQLASEKLRTQTTQAVFDAHISKMQAIKVEDGTLTLSCLPMSLDWLRYQLKPVILRAVRLVEVEVEVADVAFVPTNAGSQETIPDNGMLSCPQSQEATLRQAEEIGQIGTKPAPTTGKTTEKLEVSNIEAKAFDGFSMPKENWSKLPHELIGVLDKFSSLAELKVVLYVLRHTWGYQDQSKKITMGEFVNGRRTKNSQIACRCSACQAKGITDRIDHGLGMAAKNIRDGIKRAEADGFLAVETDTSDKARTKKYYRLCYKQIPPDP